nr:hypothetical protein [Coxiella burnetii]
MKGRNWNQASVAKLFELPFFELLYKAYETHRIPACAGMTKLKLNDEA